MRLAARGAWRGAVAARPARANKVVPEFQPWRARVVFGTLLLCMAALAGRAFQLQVLNTDFLRAEGAKRHVRELTVPGGRGAIFDRNAQPLALAAPVESVWAVPAELLAEKERLPELAHHLGLPVSALRRTLSTKSHKSFVYLRRQLDPDHARRVLALQLPGVFTQREYRRYYPASESAAQLLGVADIDLNGQEGLEMALDPLLRGVDGSRRVIKDRLGHVVEDLAEFRQPEPGANVHLSVDLRLQYLAYRELTRAVAANRADGGVVVILDPLTGEVLAMVSDPSYNPNRREVVDAAAMRQRAATDLFEPGSTIKPFVVAMGMQAGLYRPGSIIATEHGRWQVGRLLVKDIHDYGNVDLTTLLMKSSNVGAAKIGMSLGANRLWQGYRDLGIGQGTGVGFPGEAQGVLRPAKAWGQIATATSSFGYGFSVTALQLARAYAALASEGRVPELTLIRREPGAAIPVQEALSPGVARSVRAMLETVVSGHGTAKRAAVEGYRVAGKTGTVHKVAEGGGYASKRYQSLFVGMIPASAPRLVAVIMIDEPKAGAHYGGAVAAPVFAGIMQDAMRILRVPPDLPLAPAITAGSNLDRDART